MRKTSSILIAMSLAAAACFAADTTTKTPTNKPPAKKEAVIKTQSGWHEATGKIVSANIDNNTLVVKEKSKDLKFSVPGRIDMLDLKPGERVEVRYVAHGNHLHLWSLKQR